MTMTTTETKPNPFSAELRAYVDAHAAAVDEWLEPFLWWMDEHNVVSQMVESESIAEGLLRDLGEDDLPEIDLMRGGDRVLAVEQMLRAQVDRRDSAGTPPLASELLERLRR